MKTKPVTYEKYYLDFKDSLAELQEIISEIKLKGLHPKLEQHLIRSFELTHELAINTMMIYFQEQGRPAYSGSRDVTIDAFNEEMIDDGKGWLDMIICRIKATSVYTEDVKHTLVENIMKNYVHMFENFETKMDRIRNK